MLICTLRDLRQRRFGGLGYFCEKFSAMTVTYEVLNQDTLPILEQLERMRLIRKVSQKGAKNSVKTTQNAPSDKTPLLSAEEQLAAWANEPGLTPVRVAARTRLIPQLLEYYSAQSAHAPVSETQLLRKAELAEITAEQHAKKPKIKRQWAGMISPETAEKMLLHLEQVQSEWERNL